jgi:hypothetical protein
MWYRDHMATEYLEITFRATESYDMGHRNQTRESDVLVDVRLVQLVGCL